MAVEVVAHVVLDRQRLPAGDEAAADHEQRLRDADGDDQHDQDCDPVPAALALELVDDDAGQHDGRDRRSLRRDGEHGRNRQRRPVRTQEAEQSDERAAIRGAHESRLAAEVATKSARIGHTCVRNTTVGSRRGEEVGGPEGDVRNGQGLKRQLPATVRSARAATAVRWTVSWPRVAVRARRGRARSRSRVARGSRRC